MQHPGSLRCATKAWEHTRQGVCICKSPGMLTYLRSLCIFTASIGRDMLGPSCNCDQTLYPCACLYVCMCTLAKPHLLEDLLAVVVQHVVHSQHTLGGDSLADRASDALNTLLEGLLWGHALYSVTHITHTQEIITHYICSTCSHCVY